MTRFTVGQAVVSNTNAQGLGKGESYTVVKVDEQPTPFGNVVTYWVKSLVGGEVLPVGNGHLLLTEAR